MLTACLDAVSIFSRFKIIGILSDITERYYDVVKLSFNGLRRLLRKLNGGENIIVEM